MTNINLTENNRGFQTGEFTDRYGNKCSIQKSSIATEHCIWLGIDEATPKIMASDAHKLGIKTTETVGWIDYNIPKEVYISTRMHLTQQQVKDLLPLLKKFAKTGELS